MISVISNVTSMRAGSLYHQVKLTRFSGRRLTASISSKIKELNKLLSAYEQLLILIDCGIARFIRCDSMRISWFISVCKISKLICVLKSSNCSPAVDRRYDVYTVLSL